jgi:hypothetical protein
MTVWGRSKPWAELPWPRLIAAGVLLISVTVTYAGLSGPPCLWRTLLHIPCPGCGLTRSIKALWHGELIQSFRYHPLGIPIVIGCVAALMPWPAALKKRFPPYLPLWIAGITVVLMIGIWLLRMALAWSGNDFFEW